MKKQCSTCGGTGQIGFFQGVSRFLLTWEECPQCCGTGFLDPDRTEKEMSRDDGPKGGKKNTKKDS